VFRLGHVGEDVHDLAKLLVLLLQYPVLHGLNAHDHRNQSINRKGTYILADIHGTDHFCPKLAQRPYNKLESCVSKIHTHLW
jgi:hypothetical protein